MSLRGRQGRGNPARSASPVSEPVHTGSMSRPWGETRQLRDPGVSWDIGTTPRVRFPSELRHIRRCRILPGVLTFVESPLFSRLVYDYLTDDEYADFQQYLASNPDAGDVVRGSGGVRKVRWARQGSGKSGGVRVLYFAQTAQGAIWLLLIYAKSARDSVPGHVLKSLKEEMENADD